MKKILMCLMLVITMLQPLVASAQGVSADDINSAYADTVWSPDGLGVLCERLDIGAVIEGSNNEEIVWNYLIGRGLTPEQTAGVMGNLKEESGFIPTIQERSRTWPSGGWGIAQWTGGRRESIRNAVIAQLGPSYYTDQDLPDAQELELLAFQLEYMYNESQNRSVRTQPHPYITQPPAGTNEWDGLKTMVSVEDATYYWEWNFERPTEPFQDNRINGALQIYARYTGTTTTISGASTGCVPRSISDVIVGDTSDIPCAAGEDRGVADGYKDGQRYTIRICNVQGIVVNSQISGPVDDMLTAARLDGVELSGWGFRTHQRQIELRREHCGPTLYDIYEKPSSQCSPPTARPGYSNHQYGVAIDFSGIGQCPSTVNNSCADPSNEDWVWLNNNANNYGLVQFSREAWHWSTDGR